MKLIVLAAGRGRRMGKETHLKPKLLVQLGDCTLLERQFESIRASGVIDSVVYVLGYRAEEIEARLTSDTELAVVTQFNPFYDTSDNLLSLWLAKSHMDGDFAVTNGDNLFDPGVIKNALSHGDGFSLAVNSKSSYDDDDMKVIAQNGHVQRVSKLIDERIANFESVGLFSVRGEEAREQVLQTLERCARSRDYVDRYWLEVPTLLAESGVKVRAHPINGSWQEFDTQADIDEFHEKTST